MGDKGGHREIDPDLVTINRKQFERLLKVVMEVDDVMEGRIECCPDEKDGKRSCGCKK